MRDETRQPPLFGNPSTYNDTWKRSSSREDEAQDTDGPGRAAGVEQNDASRGYRFRSSTPASFTDHLSRSRHPSRKPDSFYAHERSQRQEWEPPALAAQTHPDPEVDSVEGDPVFYSFHASSGNGNQDSDLAGMIFPDNESAITDGEDLEELISGDAKARGVAAYHVLDSQYAGDGYEEGHHSVNLTAVLSGRAAVSQSMFRWV